MSSLPLVAIVALVVGLALWPVLHAFLLWEGTKVLGKRGPSLGPVLAAVFLTPLVVLAAQVGLSCLGSAPGPTPIAIAGSGLAVLVGFAVRAACYRVILDLPTRGAVGLAIGVTVVSWMYVTAMGGILFAGVWALMSAAS